MTAAEFAGLIQGARRRADGTWWDGRCPSHDDRSASLSFRDGDRGLILTCHANAGCTEGSIAAAVGVKVADLFFAKNGTRPGRSSIGTIVKTYDYEDERGVPIYQVVRFDPKNFRQRRADGKGGWIWGLGDVPRVLYRQREPRGHARILKVEGEKDADRCWSIGIPATTNVMGAGKWRVEYTAALIEAGVTELTIVPDNDKAGRDDADKVARSCLAGGLRVKILNLDVPEKGDLSDWFDAGHTVEELDALIAQTAPVVAVATSAVIIPTEQTEHLTDLGNTQRLARLHGRDVRWVKRWNAYLVFDGKLWSDDHGEQLSRWAEDVVRDLHHAAAQASGLKREALAAWALKSESAPRLRAMLDLLKSQPGIAAAPDDFDADPDLLSCTNGVLDLTVFMTRPHRREDMLTRMTAAPYEPRATSETWEKHLHENVQDADTITTLQRFASYSLTGDTREERFLFLHGPGGSGKSTTLEAIKGTLGSYARAISFDTLLAHQRDPAAPSDDLAALRGARVVIATETEGVKGWATGVVKLLTGGDTVRARGLYERSFEFKPEFKLWLAANDRPRVPVGNKPFWRRILEVPFPNERHEEAKRDPSIKAALIDPTTSGAAILAWCVAGLKAWREHGLAVSEKIKSATAAYEASQDSVGEFLDTCCHLEPTGTATPTALRAAYRRFCDESGIRPAVGNEWTSALARRGLDQARSGHDRTRVWLGVTILDKPVESAEVPF